MRRPAPRAQPRASVPPCENSSVRLRLRPVLLAVLAMVAAARTAAWAGFAPAAVVHTETVDYTYNADGALTARTTTVDGGAAATTYLTWDNFVPTAGAAASGTVSAGNGNLLGYGDNPGSDGLAVQFSFDRRNRLTGYSGGGAAITYAYDAGGLLAGASPATGSSLRVYHDAGAHMTNLRQDAGSAAELWSGDLGAARYVSDGSEQVRLTPRKDVACTYATDSEAVSAYTYTAYGAQETETSAAGSADGGYDVRVNSMQYAGEYRDALWGGYYLRARWYLPDLPLFLSRDPVAHLGRYGYGGGNPVTNVDPSGRSFRSFVHGREGWQRALQDLGGGNAWYSHVLRLTTGLLMAPLQIVANPSGFAKAILHDQGGIDLFLVGGVGVEAVMAKFGARVLTTAAVQVAEGAGQSTAAAATRGFNHFNWHTFTTGLEYTAGAELDTFAWRAVKATAAGVRARMSSRASRDGSFASSDAGPDEGRWARLKRKLGFGSGPERPKLEPLSTLPSAQPLDSDYVQVSNPYRASQFKIGHVREASNIAQILQGKTLAGDVADSGGFVSVLPHDPNEFSNFFLDSDDSVGSNDRFYLDQDRARLMVSVMRGANE